ncbi:MAG TPA: exodeoxyribonuclease VII large subunit, partial [Candidatus Dormibacteraeota bacterium]|nr:exodeoxyribonuclease VII large subunit [Candidatus Dormibacteraeota bacterium]
ADERRGLQESGLYSRQADQVHVAAVPLRVGLVGVEGSKSEFEVTTALASGGFAIAVTFFHVQARMADALAGQVAQKIALAASGVDVIILLPVASTDLGRGIFDADPVVRAVANASVPVITAVGPDDGRTLADEVAHRACSGPHVAADFVLTRLAGAEQRLLEASRNLEKAHADARLELRGRRRRSRQRRASAAIAVLAAVSVAFVVRPTLLPADVAVAGPLLLGMVFWWSRVWFRRPVPFLSLRPPREWTRAIEELESCTRTLPEAANMRELEARVGAGRALVAQCRKQLGKEGG